MVIGEHGTGKTYAAQMLYRSLQTEQAGISPMCCYYRALPKATPKHFVTTLYSRFSQEERDEQWRIPTQGALSAVVNFFRQPQMRLLIVDEAESLSPQCYDLLQHLFDETHAPMLLLRSGALSMKIQSHQRFLSRVGPQMTFDAPTEREVIYAILPQLKIPGWSFDPSGVKDHQIGAEIWQAVKPSLRRLRTLLEIASHLAQVAGEQRITYDMLYQALILMGYPSQDKG